VLRLEPPSPPLDDGVVRLEPLTLDDEADMDAIARDPDVARFTYVPVAPARDFARSWIERYLRGWEEGALAGFAVRESGGSAFLGFAGVVRLDADGREGEIGFIVAPAARGKGVATRALALLSSWALQAGLLRIELRIDVENSGSIRVAERAGFVRDGVLRSVHFKQGLRSDVAVYSLLPGDVPPAP
jgi:RimJ/RimL family protein N-acetyltransferase